MTKEPRQLTPEHVQEVYAKAHFLPDAGHTDPQKNNQYKRQELCFVGALAWADASNFDPETESAENYVGRMYALTPYEIECMEGGFDRAMRGEELPDDPDVQIVQRGYEIGLAMKTWRQAEIRRLTAAAIDEPKARYEHQKWLRRKAVEEKRARRIQRQADRVLAEAEDVIWREAVKRKKVLA